MSEEVTQRISLKRLFDPFEWDVDKIYFYDRDEERKRLLTLLNDVRKGRPTIIMISGPGGAGKSCFLKYLEKNLANTEECYPIYVRWHERHILGLAPFLQEFCNQLLTERKHGKARKIWRRLKDSFEITLPIFDLLGINRLSVLRASIDLQKLIFTDQHSDVLEKLFLAIGKALKAVFSEKFTGERGILFFLLDQAEDLLVMDKGLNTDALTFLLVLLKFVYADNISNRRIVFVFAITDRNYAEFHTKLVYQKPRGVSIEAIRIEMFSKEDARQLIEETMHIGMKRRKNGKDWAIKREVIERIADLSHGNPAWIHEVGRSLRIRLEKALEKGMKQEPIVDVDLYEVAVPKLIHDLIMINLEPIKNSETQCKILEYIARKGRATPHEIAKANIRGLKDLKHEETVQQIEGILRTGFLTKIGGIGWLSVYEVPEWVRDSIVGALYQVQQEREREVLAKKKIKLAKERSRLESQIESVDRLLESAEQTLEYWSEQYNRFQAKKQLTVRRRLLERELAWVEVEKRERVVMELKNILEKQKTELSRIEEEMKSKSQQIKEYNVIFEAAKTQEEIRDASNMVINARISLALLKQQREYTIKERKESRRELRMAESELDQTTRTATQTGPKTISTRKIMEILAEMRVTDGKLAALADVSEDVERMYESYAKLYDELKSKARDLRKRKSARAHND